MSGEYNGTRVSTRNKRTLQDNWSEFVEACAWEYGHGGYSGTFAEKPLVTVIPVPKGQKFWALGEAQKHCCDNNPKWGPAWAYLIGKNEYYVGGWCSS